VGEWGVGWGGVVSASPGGGGGGFQGCGVACPFAVSRAAAAPTAAPAAAAAATSAKLALQVNSNPTPKAAANHSRLLDVDDVLLQRLPRCSICDAGGGCAGGVVLRAQQGGWLRGLQRQNDDVLLHALTTQAGPNTTQKVERPSHPRHNRSHRAQSCGTSTADIALDTRLMNPEN